MFIVIESLLFLTLTTSLVQASCSWTAWSPCSHQCGNAGVQSRSRTKIVWGSCSGASSQTKSCNRLCYNSGTPRHRYCDCPDEFWGKCCENACTTISNCLAIICTNGTNQQCRRCNFDYGGEKKAFRLTSDGEVYNKICEKICSWRSDSRFCYPGKCPGVPSSCQCAPGFGSANCLTINAKPRLLHCVVSVLGSHGLYRAKTDIRCESETKTVVYTHIIPSVIKFDLESVFIGLSINDYPRPYYINDFSVGITDATFIYTLEHGGTRLNEVTVACSGDISNDHPSRGRHSCTKEYVISNITLQHTDRIHVKVYIKNGGFVKINNFDSSRAVSKYYTGQTTVHLAELIIDLINPFHCSVGYTCSDNMLDRGPPITKSTNFVVRWAGWSDTFSGIKTYHLLLYKMDVSNNGLSNYDVEPIVNTTFTSGENIFNSALSEPGVYAVLLAVEDMAGSMQVARRFFIFDDTNNVSINTENNKQLRVNSANKNTSYTWLLSLQDVDNTGEQVEVIWRGHFANVFQHKHKFLNGIGPNSPPIQAGYEELTGQPPDTVSREAIPNVNAIVRFDLSYAVDHLGGRSLNAPGSWTNVAAFQTEQMRVHIPRADGDSVRVWVRATDVMGNTNTDSVLVHVDSSPPVIQDVRPGESHSTETLHPTYEVDAYDSQSGLKEIHWQLRDSRDYLKLYGGGQMTIRARTGIPSDCYAPGCYCIPKNNECNLRKFQIKPDMNKIPSAKNKKGVDYELVITVVNNAMLSATSVQVYNYTNEYTDGQLNGNTKESVPVPVIAGGSAAGVAVIAVVTVAAICCLMRKSRTRDNHGETNTNEPNKETDTETLQYTDLHFNNPEYTSTEVDDDDAIYENPY